MNGHIHAELMAQYAQDALETDTPWQRWQRKEKNTNWMDCYGGIPWHADVEYRRRPEPGPEAIYTYTHRFIHFYGEEAETVDSILNASHISIYKVDEHGFESLVYEMELPETLLAIFDTHRTAVELYNQL